MEQLKNDRWPIVELDEVIELTFGKRITKKDHEGTKYPVYGGGGESFRTDDFNRENEFVISRFAMSEKCVRFVKGKFFLLDSGFTYAMKSEKKMLKAFADKILLSKQKEIYQCSRGLAQRNLDLQRFKKIKVPLSPLNIQKEIVKKLEKFMLLWDNLESNFKIDQKNAEALMSATLREQLTQFRTIKRKKSTYKIQRWKMVELGDVAEVNSGSPAPQNKALFKNGNYPFCRTSDVGKAHISSKFADIKDHLNKQGIKNLKPFKKKTILFPKSGASTFLNHRVMLNIESYVSSHLATISAIQNKIAPKFLFYLLCKIDAKKLTSNQSYPSLKLSAIKKIKIPLPPIEEQERIVEKIDQVMQLCDQLEAQVKSNQKDSEALMNSVLREAFEVEV